MGIPLLLAAILATAAPAREKLTAPDAAEVRKVATEAVLEDIQAGNLDAAEKNARQLLKDLPDDPAVLNLLGSVQTKKKDYAAARETFGKALAAEPGFFPAQFNLGELLFLEKDYAGARSHFAAMRRDDPKNELLQFKLVLCDIQAGDDDRARRVLRAIRYPGDSPAWYYAQAAWENKQGNPKKARKLVSTAREIFGEKTALFDESFQGLGLPF
jgi:predicted Zn-dependent protease